MSTFPAAPRAGLRRIMQSYGLVTTSSDALNLKRLRCGKGFRFVDAKGRTIRDEATVARLRSLAMPPAYENVRYADDPAAHLQAVGEDAAGRLQYRYHPLWTDVRETLKARRLADFARSLPAIRQVVRKCLRGPECQRWTIAAVVLLVSQTALRAGSDSYAREHGTRGATTLLKTNVRLEGAQLRLQFVSKGGKKVVIETRDKRLAEVVGKLLGLPGRRLFQYRGTDGELHTVRASDVNLFLREAAGRRLSLKDFRTLVASANVMCALASAEPVATRRGRQAQLKQAIVAAAETLTNTPTICKKSYVHGAVIAAYEAGALEGLRLRPGTRDTAETLARLVTRYAMPNGGSSPATT